MLIPRQTLALALSLNLLEDPQVQTSVLLLLFVPDEPPEAEEKTAVVLRMKAVLGARSMVTLLCSDEMSNRGAVFKQNNRLCLLL